MLDTLKSSATEAAPADASASPLRLTRLRPEAQQLILNQMKIGHAIKSQRLTYVEDLEQARSEKQEWVARTTELLKQLFSNGSIAEQCNDWVGPILPEYAEWDLFVEQFVNEMKHRIGRLQMLVKRLDAIPEPAPGEATEIRTTARPTEAPAPAPARPSPIQWSGQLISRVADEALQQTIKQFLAKLDIPVEAGDENGLVEFALILKDTTASNPDELFELGCCVGRFGAERVCILHRGPVPENTRGVRHITLDDTCGWQLLLARHLKNAGVPVDLNRLV